MAFLAWVFLVFDMTLVARIILVGVVAACVLLKESESTVGQNSAVLN